MREELGRLGQAPSSADAFLAQECADVLPNGYSQQNYLNYARVKVASLAAPIFRTPHEISFVLSILALQEEADPSINAVPLETLLDVCRTFSRAVSTNMPEL